MPDLYSVVVVGAMNPKIHHPHWYFAQGLLTAAERDAALAADLICTSPAAQFRAPEFTVVCQLEKWEILTSLDEAVGRIEQVAARVFTVLSETPVSAMGFNFNVHRETAVESVASVLARKSVETALGLSLPEGADHSAHFSLRAAADGRRISITLSPSSRGRRFIYISINTHYDSSDVVGPGGHFDLGKRIRDRFQADRVTAMGQVDSIVQGIGSSEGESHGD